MADLTSITQSLIPGAARIAAAVALLGASSVAASALAQSGRPSEPPRSDIDVTTTLARSQLREAATA